MSEEKLESVLTLVEPSTTDDAAKPEKKCPALVVINQKLIDLSNIEMEVKVV